MVEPIDDDPSKPTPLPEDSVFRKIFESQKDPLLIFNVDLTELIAYSQLDPRDVSFCLGWAFGAVCRDKCMSKSDVRKVIETFDEGYNGCFDDSCLDRLK
jgi:hypothetical protein